MTGVCEPRLKASAATLPAMVSVVAWAEVGTAACSAQSPDPIRFESAAQRWDCREMLMGRLVAAESAG